MRRETSPRLRVETDLSVAFQFLQLNGYPFFWSPEELKGCLVCRIIDDGADPLGYFWGNFEDTGIFRFHFCVREGARLPLFSSPLMQLCIDAAFLVGADEAVTSIDLHPNPAPIARLLRRCGFREEPDDEGGSDFTLNLWTNQ